MLKKLLTQQIHQSWCIVGLCVGIITGMIIAITLKINFFISSVWLIVATILTIITFRWPKIILIPLALIAGMILAFYRVAGEFYDETYVQQFYGQTVTITGTINGDPTIDTDEGTTKLKLTNLQFGEEKIKTSGSIYITLNDTEILERADEIKVSGKLMEGFGTYVGYIYRPKVLTVHRPEPGDLILKVRNWFAGRIRTLLPETEAALGLSYLMGMKTGLPKELNKNLRMVGLVHIVVASGAHLSILVNLARKIFGKVSRFIGVLFAILFVILFMGLVGWTPSIIRAGVMAILTLVTWYSGRKIMAWRLILIVGSFTLILDPMYLIDLGWLLSFASYAGIMILGPKLTKFFYGERKPGFIAGMILTSLSATVMTLPITLYYYGTMSLVAVVANLLILPTLPWAMGLTFTTGVVADAPGIEVVTGWLATKILEFHIEVVNFFSKMPQFIIEIPPYQTSVFLIYVLIAGLMIIGFLRKRRLKHRREYNRG